MRTDFVLNNDEKNKRFQKSLRQTNEESDDEDNDFEIVEVVKTSRKRIIPDQQKEKRDKLDSKSSKSKSKLAPNYQPRTCSFEMDSASDKEPDYETDDPWDIPIPDDVEESQSESTEECFLDPETGLLVDPSKKEKKMIYNGMEVQNSGLTLPIDKAKSFSFPAYKYTGKIKSLYIFLLINKFRRCHFSHVNSSYCRFKQFFVNKTKEEKDYSYG